MINVRRLFSPIGAATLGGLALLCGLALGSCGPRDCRNNPNCGGGGIGAFCAENNDCYNGYCCDKKECADGMCTFRCDGNNECPPGMACEHDACFYRCGGDSDCLPDQECKHDVGICEWR